MKSAYKARFNSRRVPPFFTALVGAASCASIACGADKGTTPLAKATVPDSAEQVYFGIRHSMVESGVNRGQLQADSALVFDRNNRYEMRGNLVVTIFDSVGALSATITANQATYNVPMGNVEARGNVVVVTTDGKRLDTPQLFYDQRSNRIRSDSAFVFVEPNQRITGSSFITDPKLAFHICNLCTYTGSGGAPGRGGGG
jgi:LPS export ABC transporter protein LptC